MTTTYIAGPMRGKPLYNYQAFEDAAQRLTDRGRTVVSPHQYDIDKGWADVRYSVGSEWRRWGRMFISVELTDSFPFDTDMLREHNFDCIDGCSVIALLPGWQLSEGARAEVEYGLSQNKHFDLVTPIEIMSVARYWVSHQLKKTDQLYRSKTYEQRVAEAEAALEEEEAILKSISGVSEVCMGPIFTDEMLSKVTESEEVRVRNDLTGGEKGSKPERYDLIPVEPLRQVARHYGIGALKYDDRNWERGYDWHLSYAALQRHAQAFWGGEDLDPESKTPHLAAIVFHAFALMEWATTHPELDDRPSTLALQAPNTLEEM